MDIEESSRLRDERSDVTDALSEVAEEDDELAMLLVVGSNW
jgi:hypothetical protein